MSQFKLYLSPVMLTLLLIGCATDSRNSIPMSGVESQVAVETPTFTPRPTLTSTPTNVPIMPTPTIIPEATKEKSTCNLTGGELVEEGWTGKDTGSNFCNQCICMKVGLACTRMACFLPDLPTKDPTPMPTIMPTSTPTTAPTPTAKPVMENPDILLTDHHQFFKDVADNIIAARAKYKEVLLRFDGKVMQIDEVSEYVPSDGFVVLGFRNPERINCSTYSECKWLTDYREGYQDIEVNCGLKAENLVNLLPGGEIIVQGQITSSDYTTELRYYEVTLEPCAVISYTGPR